MPIRKSRTARTGVDHAAAHSVVTQIRLYPEENRGVITVNTYASAAHRTARNSPLDGGNEEFAVSGQAYIDNFADNILIRPGNSPAKNAEAYLRTLPEFIGGVEV